MKVTAEKEEKARRNWKNACCKLIVRVQYRRQEDKKKSLHCRKTNCTIKRKLKKNKRKLLKKLYNLDGEKQRL